MDKAIAILAIMLLSACSTTGSLCPAGPIILDKNDTLTRSTAEQIVALNNSGMAICGWKAPRS